MDPSSLIFVAIIGIWAAYLLGHWVRRRDQLATARSIDRFSSAMRVLERRAPVPALARPQARAYVVAPVRPVYARMAPAPEVRTPAPPAVRSAPQGDGGHDTRPGADVRRGSARSAAVRRRRLLAGLGALTLTGWLLVVFTVLAWWVAALPTLALVGFVAQLRALARQRQQRQQRQLATRHREVARPGRESMQAVVGHVVASRGQRLAASAQRAASARGIAEAQQRTEARNVPSTGSMPAQVERLSDVSDAQLSASSGEQWQPVPVPPPTYTLKPKAPTVIQARVSGAPEATEPNPVNGDQDNGDQDNGDQAHAAAPIAEPVPAEVPTFDLDEILERRIASGA